MALFAAMFGVMFAVLTPASTLVRNALCIANGAAAVAGSILKINGWSPGRISGREPEIDWFVNHLWYFGPSVLACWILCVISRNRYTILWIPGLSTILFVVALLSENR